MCDKNSLFTRFEEWVRYDIPQLNNMVEEGNARPEDLLFAVQLWIGELHEKIGIDLGRLSQEEARKLIQLIGFGVSSIERHYQARDPVPGKGLAQLSGIDEIMVRLSQIAHHPPRDSHYTYWKWNAGEHPLTFTGDPQEVFFNRAVNSTDKLHAASCDALRPICQGELPITSSCGVDALHYAEQNTMMLHERFRSFMVKDTALNRRNMEPWFFMNRMRTYLPTYPIQGTLWEGVNAANLTSQVQMDYLLGTVNDEYAHTIRERFRFLTEEDRHALEADIALPSVADILMGHLELTPEEVKARGIHELGAHIAGQPLNLQDALGAFGRLFKATAHLTAMHWALIQNYLDKPAAKLTESEREKLAVKPDRGTGGKTREQTKAIMNMRREHPVIGKLVAGIELVHQGECQQSLN